MWTAIITALPRLLEFLLEVIKLRMSKAGDKAVDIATMYDSMSDVLYPGGIDRILILWYHNGGGNISADKPLYVTCVHEVRADGLAPVKTRYKSLEVDHHYAKMVSRIYQEKEFVAESFNLQMGSMLKNMYHEERVTKSKMYFIKHSKKGLWFVSFRSNNEMLSFNDVDTKMRVAVSTIKKTMG